MGRIRHELRASAALSDHGTDEDARDARLWNTLVQEVRALVAEPCFADLGWSIDVDADEAPDYEPTQLDPP